ncbi:phage tail tape measure protein [Clostridium perfringens]|uniref:phage tail tape measure protein n=3 Tax=Clostridium perfringens TaxID=1502 RepID=UPI0001663C81|nr:phage tail tape measure protein [Clostridium perfringens]EDS79174.1 putative phage tail tape meausure protein, family [Clostridium perfringens C str. JGS1495]
MELFTLFGKIAVNDKDANKSIDNVTGRAKQAEGQMGATFGKIGKAVTTAFTVAAVGAFEKKIVDTYSTYDDQMRKVQAVSGATGKAYQELRAKAEELGAKTRFSATEAGQGMENLARAGWKTGQIMSGIGPVLSFATANAIDLGSAAGIVADGLSQFGLQAQDTGMFTDVLSATAAAANTDIGLLGETLKYAGAPAGALGYKLQDVAVAMGLMADKGVKGSQAGTTLRSAFVRLANPTGESAKAMKKLGISITDSTGKVKPFLPLMQELRSKFSKLTDAQKAQMASTIFGQEAMSGMLAVVNSSDEEFNKMTNAIKNCDGQTQKMADTMDGGLGGAIASVKSAWEGFLIKLGSVQDGLLVGAFNLLALAIRGLSPVIDGISFAFQTLFNIIKNNPIIQGFVAPFKVMIEHLQNGMSVCGSFYQAFMNLFPDGSILVSDFIGAIEFGLKGLVALAKGNVEEARDWFYSIFPDDVENMLQVDKIMNIISNIKNVFQSTFDAIGNIVVIAMNIAGGAFEALGAIWVTVSPTIVSGLLTIIQIVTSFASITVSAISSVISSIKDVINWFKQHELVAKTLGIALGILGAGMVAYNLQAHGVVGTLKLLSNVLGITALKTKIVSAAQTAYIAAMYAAEFATKAFAIAVRFLTSSFGIVSLVIAAVVAIGYLVYRNWDLIKAKAQELWQAITEAWNGICEATSNAWNNVCETISSVWESIVTTVSNFINTCKEVITGIWNSICEATSTAWEFIKNIVTFGVMAIASIIEAMAILISTPFMFVWENIKEYVFMAWEYIKSIVSAGINYVSNIINTVLTVVFNTFSSVWNSILNVCSTVWNTISTIAITVWNVIKAFFLAWFNWYVSTAISIFNIVKNVATTVWNAISNVATIVWSAIKSFFLAWFNWYVSTVTSIFNIVKNVITTVWNAIRAITSAVWNSIKAVITSVLNAISSTVRSIASSIKSAVTSAWNSIRSVTSSVWNSIRSVTSSVWNGIKNAIQTPISAAVNFVGNQVQRIKNFFSGLHIQLPHIKLPHFKLSGEFSLMPPSVPHLGVDWYAEGGILTKPTMFGMRNGRPQVGGEAGPEAVLPIEKLGGILADTLRDIGYGGQQPIIINIDGREVFNAMSPYMASAVRGRR